jgi:DUF4097 and DUF4098 domain-containing protein YvlB
MTTLTRRLTCTFAALALAAPVLAQAPAPQKRPAPAPKWSALTWAESWQARQGPEQTERITKTFKVGPNGSLDLSAISGDVIVNEGGGDTITVDALKRVRSRSADEAKQQLANTNVTMAQSGDRVEVRVDYTGRDNHASVDFTVTAPAGTAVNARSVSGDVQVKGIKGEVRVESVSGDVSATATPNLSLIKTVSGDLQLSALSGQDNLNVSTVSGNLTLRSIKAHVINAESVSGEMSLTDVTCERATVKSVSGDVEYFGPLTKGGRYELKSHSGDIRLTLTEDVGFELEAQSFSGNVRSDLPVTTRAGDAQAGRHRRSGLRGTHGDGSALLMLSTFSGDITVVKK